MLKITKSFFDSLDFDFDAAVSEHQKALDDHRYTVDVPAPTANPLVEAVVRAGGYEIEDDTLPHEA